MKITAKELLELMRVSDTINYWVKEYQSKNNELNCFKEEYSCLLSNNNNYEKINAELMLENKEVKSELEILKADYASLETDKARLKEANNKMFESNNKLSKEIESLNLENSKVWNRNKELLVLNAELEKALRDMTIERDNLGKEIINNKAEALEVLDKYAGDTQPGTKYININILKDIKQYL